MFTFIAAALLQVASFVGAPAANEPAEEAAKIAAVLSGGEEAMATDLANALASQIVEDASADGGIGGWGHDVNKYLTDGGIGGWGHDFNKYFAKHPEKTNQIADIIADGGIGGWGHD